MKPRIYLDYAAATPVDPRVFKVMEPYITQQFGNPGSLHAFGQEAIAAVDKARETIARHIGADFRQIIFTGSATEANNLALQGTLLAAKKERPQIIVSAIEHESILEAARAAEQQGAEVIYLPVGKEGLVDPASIQKNLNERTVFVSVLYAQNEVGTVQAIQEIAKIVKDFRGKNKYPLFHTDAAQAFQFLECNVSDLGVDLMTLSGQKIYGPKGVGALYTRDIKSIASIIRGGGQEFGLRSGTENVPAIAGFAKAVDLIVETRDRENENIIELRKKLWDGIKNIFGAAEMNGTPALPSILNVYFPGYEAQDLLTRFDLAGLAASSGSACHSRALEASYVIEAMGHSRERAKSSIRFSVGRPTTERDIIEALNIIRETFSRKKS